MNDANGVRCSRVHSFRKSATRAWMKVDHRVEMDNVEMDNKESVMARIGNLAAAVGLFGGVAVGALVF